MAKKNDNERKPFNFGDAPLVKTTEKNVVENYEAVKAPAAPAESNSASRAGKNINIELSLALHTRLKIACASQNRKIKDIVPEIIADWVDKQERI